MQFLFSYRSCFVNLSPRKLVKTIGNHQIKGKAEALHFERMALAIGELVEAVGIYQCGFR
jgi:hypothetical protein